MTFWRFAACLFLGSMCLLKAPSPVEGTQAQKTQAQKTQALDTCFPPRTRALLVVPEAGRFFDAWQHTGAAQLAAHPDLKPFLDEVERYLRTHWSDFHRDHGFSAKELRDQAKGAVAWGLVETADHQLVPLGMVDVDPAAKEFQSLLKRVEQRLAKAGATRQPADGEVTVYRLAPAAAGASPRPRQVVWAIVANRLLVSFDLGVLNSAMVRLKSAPVERSGSSLLRNYREQTQPESSFGPSAFWYAQPVEIIASMGQRDPGQKATLKKVRRHGLSSVEGLGGHVAVSERGGRVMHRTVVTAPPPQRNSLAMLRLVNGPGVPTEAPANACSWLGMRWDLGQIVDHLDALFDDWYADGIDGTYRDVLRDLKKELKVDVRDDLAANLGPEIAAFKTSSDQGEQLGVKIQVRNEGQVDDAIRKMLVDDPTATAKKVPGYPRTVWQFIGNDKQGRAVMTVANGYVLFASEAKLLDELRAPSPQRLESASDYQLALELLSLDESADALRVFVRLREDLADTYRAVRRGKIAEESSFYAIVARAVLPSKGSDAKRPNEGVDFSKLPDYQRIRDLFGTAVTSVRTIPKGWILIGIVLPADSMTQGRK